MSTQADILDALRSQIENIARGRPPARGALSFGVMAIDQHLPGGGLARGALHEVAGGGPEVEHAGSATLFVAGVLARLRGPVVWVLQHPDLFAPGLACVGLKPDRVIYVEAGKQDAALQAAEEALRHAGLAIVVEISSISLAASRRLALAAAASGSIGFILRRSRRGSEAIQWQPNAAATRWQIAALPSPPPIRDAPHIQGIGRARWELQLLRCRGGEPASWIVEACDAKGRLRLAAGMADRKVPASPQRAAG
jgi:protein ImuA